jgi:hypothetical protein
MFLLDSMGLTESLSLSVAPRKPLSTACTHLMIGRRTEHGVRRAISRIFLFAAIRPALAVKVAGVRGVGRITKALNSPLAPLGERGRG